jgi:hypothetical protein
MGPGPGDPLAPMPTATAPDQGTAREPLFNWFKRKPIAWIGAGVTVVGLGMGIGFSAAAAGASNNVNNYAKQINEQGKANGLTSPPCGKEDDPSDDNPVVFYTDPSGKQMNACETLRGSLSQYRADVAVAATGWVLFGLGAVGTVTYALLDWYPKRTSTGQGVQVTGVAPIIAPTQGGVAVTGEF